MKGEGRKGECKEGKERRKERKVREGARLTYDIIAQ